MNTDKPCYIDGFDNSLDQYHHYIGLIAPFAADIFLIGFLKKFKDTRVCSKVDKHQIYL